MTLHLDSIEQAWKLLIVTGAGTGTVLLLRWFWWRINAWSEVSAMVVAAAVSLFLQLGLKWDSDRPRDFAYIMIVTVASTTIGWLVVTWMTPPEPAETLLALLPPRAAAWPRLGPDRGGRRPARRFEVARRRAAQRTAGLCPGLRLALRHRRDPASQRRARGDPAGHRRARRRPIARNLEAEERRDSATRNAAAS